MTTHTTNRARRPVTQRAAGRNSVVRDHTVTGTATQIANLLTNHRNAGTLVAATTPCPITGGRFHLTIWIRVYLPARPAAPVAPTIGHARTRVRHSRRIAVIATTVAGAAAGVLAVAAYLLGQLVELVAAHAATILGVLALAAILAGLCTGRTGRRHCPGC